MAKSKLFINILLGVVLLMVPLIGLSRMGSEELDYSKFSREHARSSIAELKAQGLYHIQQEHSDSALACFALVESRIDDRLSRRDYELALDVLNNTGYIYQYLLHDYPQAFSYYTRALELCKKIDYKLLQPCLHLNIGNLYANFEEYAIAHNHYKTAIALGAEYGNHEIMSITVNNLLMDKLRKGFDQSSDSAIMIYRQANIPDTIPLSRYTRYLLNGCEALRQGNYEKALQIFALAQTDIDTEYRPRVYVTDCFMAMAVTNHLAGNTQRAIDCLNQALEGLEGDEDDDIRIDLYQLLIDYYKQMGQADKAKEAEYMFYRIYHDLFSARTAAQVHDMKARQQIEAQNATTREMVRRHRTVVTISIIVGVGLMVIILLLWSLYRKGQRQKQLIENLYNRALAEAKGIEAPKSAKDSDPQKGHMEGPNPNKSIGHGDDNDHANDKSYQNGHGSDAMAGSDNSGHRDGHGSD
ncbi:MAG: tetratricopeptide repeat protein, partial [Bacteroidales bacterium]|nr:tetratricopeptide repeat protein [Bacteroidales bacterium]